MGLKVQTSENDANSEVYFISLFEPDLKNKEI